MQGTRADRAYLAGLGVLAVAGAGGAWVASRTHQPRVHRAGVAAAAIASGALLVGLYGRYVEPSWLQTCYVRLPWRGRPLRVGFLTDLHAGTTSAARIQRAVRRVLRARPDLILLGGDYVSGFTAPHWKLQRLAPLSELWAPLGVFGVLGNHDTEPAESPTPRAGAIAARLRRLGVTLLENVSVELSPGVQLVAMGSYRAGHSHAAPAFHFVREEDAVLVLVHNWQSLRDAAMQRFDLALSGHTHGGQGRVPLLGYAPALEDDMKPYSAGLYEWPAGGHLYVSRGIGESSVHARIGSRPEVTIVDLVPHER
jgi:hypothetical protein